MKKRAKSIMARQPYKDADGTVIDYEKKAGHTFRRLCCGFKSSIAVCSTTPKSTICLRVISVNSRLADLYGETD